MNTRRRLPRVPAIRAELTRTCSFLWCQMVSVLMLGTTITCALCANVRVSTGEMSHAERVPEGIGLSLCLVLFGVFGALVASQDLRSGELSVSMLAIADRFRLSAVRITACSGIAVAMAGVVFFCDQTVRLVISDRPIPTPPPVPVTALGFTLASVTYTMLGLVLAELTRHTMVSIAIIVLTPVLVTPVLEHLSASITQLLPFNAVSLMQGRGHCPVPVVHPVACGVLILFAWWCMAACTLTAHITWKNGET